MLDQDNFNPISLNSLITVCLGNVGYYIGKLNVNHFKKLKVKIYLIFLDGGFQK